MNKENYPSWLVPLEIAIRLKEIGFNEYCPFFVYPNDDEVFISGTVTVEEDWLDEDNYGEVIIDLSVTECGKFNKYNFQTIPTWEQVFKWFRSKGFNFHIEYTSDNELFKTNIIGVLLHTNVSYFETYEEAREELVNKLIELYGNNK